MQSRKIIYFHKNITTVVILLKSHRILKRLIKKTLGKETSVLLCGSL